MSNPDFFQRPDPSPVAAPARIPVSPAGSMAPPPAAAQLQSGRSFRAAAQPAVEAAAERENDDGLGRSADSAPSLPTPRLIQQASYWTYKAPPTPAEAPPGMTGDWRSLTPGMRREIWRSYDRSQTAAPDAAPERDHRREYLDRKTAVQIAARERL